MRGVVERESSTTILYHITLHLSSIIFLYVVDRKDNYWGHGMRRIAHPHIMFQLKPMDHLQCAQGYNPSFLSKPSNIRLPVTGERAVSKSGLSFNNAWAHL